VFMVFVEVLNMNGLERRVFSWWTDESLAIQIWTNYLDGCIRNSKVDFFRWRNTSHLTLRII
jgi:hypothetical protein